MKSPKNPKKRPKAWAVLSGVAIQMGVSLYLASRAGKALDAHWDTGKTFTLIILMLVLFLNMYWLVKYLERFNS
ncbi:MAG: Uncharacterised protein [Bacteroidota bacterium]|nr:MAG: Uncharacterised protein [Bacteroidota bacterium]